MKIGVTYPQIELNGDPEAVRSIGLAVEELGYDSLLAYDHVVGAEHAGREPELWGPYTESDPFHCPFTIFSYLAAITTHIEFVTGVIILPQRQTALVAKQCTDIDLLSGERLRLGVQLVVLVPVHRRRGRVQPALHREVRREQGQARHT